MLGWRPWLRREQEATRLKMHALPSKPRRMGLGEDLTDVCLGCRKTTTTTLQMEWTRLPKENTPGDFSFR